MDNRNDGTTDPNRIIKDKTKSMRIEEIKRIPQHHYSGGKDWMLDQLTAAERRHSQELPGGLGLRWTQLRRDYPGVAIFNQDGVIGELELKKAADFPVPAQQVYAITVDEEWQGQGIARALYGIVLALQKQTLVAGEEQTPGGRRNWLSLASIPGVEVRGYLKLPDSWFENRRARRVDIDQLLKDIMALGAEHIGTKNGEHFFGFPIVPGQTELKAPVVNTIRTYGASALETGLYAKWTGQ